MDHLSTVPVPDRADRNPFTGLTYAHALREIAAKFGSNEALVLANGRWTFAEVVHEVDVASARLHQLGLVSGDRVALWLPNRAEFLWYWLGASQAGLIAVVLNTRLRADEAAYQIEQSGSRALIVPGDGGFKDFLADIASVRSRLPKLQFLIALDPTSRPGVIDWSKPSSQLLPTAPLAQDPDAPALISYSSGTTALPKGALITHCVFRKAWDIGIRIDQTERDKLLLAIPLFGSLAMMNGVLPFWVRGGAVIVAERFDAAAFVSLAQREQCTVTHLLPQMMHALAQLPLFNSRDLASLRVNFIVSNDKTIFSLAEDTLGLKGVMQGYGLTESTTVAVRNRWDDSREVRLNTQGYALPDVELKVVDPATGASLPAGEQGEIWVRGYCIMKGYYNKPDETAKAIDAEGWLHTGDIGKLDANGRLTFLYRASEGYKTNGFNVGPAEIEAALRRHPDVLEAAVFGRQDAIAGQVGVACVIAQQGRTISEAEVLAFLRPLLASYKMPRHILQLDAFPTTAGTGKVQKFKLQTEVESRLLEIVSARTEKSNKT